MAATDRGRIAGVPRGARQAAGYAHGIELGCDSHRARSTRMADGRQAIGKLLRMRIDIEAQYVQGMTVPGDRDLDAGNQQDIDFGGGLRRFRKTTGFVVVSQRQQAYASGGRPPDQGRRRQHPIGVRGVGM